MKTTLGRVTCARLPASGLACLAGLRRLAGVSVREDGDRAWVSWPEGDDRVVRALLPEPGVEFFERRGAAWHRFGRELPCFDGPPEDRPAVGLAGAVVPAPFDVLPADAAPFAPSTIRLARDDRPRPTSAAFCPLVELGRWADAATSREIEAVRGAIRGNVALILGPNLPAWPGSTRYWGVRLLVPTGFEVRPRLPESAILEALGASADEVFRVVPALDGGDIPEVEAIPLEAFRALSRAGIRLALGAES